MPWVPLRTYVAGEMMTAAILNTDHRDNAGEFFRLRASYGVSSAAGTPLEIVNTGSQSYPGFPLYFRWANGSCATGASVTLRDDTTVLTTLAGASGFDTGGNRSWYLDEVTNGVHRYNLYAVQAGGGTLYVFERGID